MFPVWDMTGALILLRKCMHYEGRARYALLDGAILYCNSSQEITVATGASGWLCR